jgi:hypothetical protein
MIKISWETQGLIKKLEDLSTKGIKYAVSMALTWAAQDARDTAQRELNEKIDRPTPLTRRAVRLQKIEKGSTERWVYIQDEASKGNPPSKYLKALLLGGYRANKRSERQLRVKGILPPGWQMEPGADMPQDQYGNLQGGGGRYTQILSALKSFQENGYQANRTARSAKRNKAQRDYFVLWSIKTRTPIGIYTRKGTQDIPQIFKFVPKRARYNKILDFKGTVERTFHQVFEKHFREGLQRMIIKVSKW